MNLVPFAHDSIEQIKQMREQSLAVERMCVRLSSFLAAAFPHAAGEARLFAESVYGFMECGVAEQIDRMEKAAANPPARGGGFVYPAATPDLLASLVSQRDALEAQIEAVENAKTEIERESGSKSMAAMLEGSLSIMGTRQHLEQVNEAISRVQKELESQNIEAPE